jgi:histidinol-phosphate aminotransferase
VRGPFNVNAPAIAAGTAAIRDRGHTERAVAHNTRWLGELPGRVEDLGFRVPPSVGNFILVDFSTVNGGDAAAADDFLGERGVIMRRMTGYGLPQMLRMTIGDDEANEAALTALTDYRNALARG